MKHFIKLFSLLAILAMLSGCSLKDAASGFFPSDKAPANPSAETTEAPVNETQPIVMKTVYGITGARYEYDGSGYDYRTTYDEAGVHFLAEDRANAEDLHYDWNGNLIRNDSYTEEGELNYFVVYVYDEAGRKLSWTQTWPDGKSVGEVFTYNEQGQLILDESIRRDGERGSYTEYYYDDAGRVSSSRFYDYMGEFASTDYYTYNDAGQLIKQETVNEEGHGFSSGGYFTYSYDSLGRLTQKIWTDASPSSTRGEFYYTYDNQGRLAAYEKWTFGSIDEDVHYIYDDQGYFIGSNDPAEGSVITYYYGQITLPQPLADTVALWSKDGVLVESVIVP